MLDPDHRLIRADLADPERPASAISIVVEAFRRRMQAGRSPFTALTCDNVHHNGHVLKAGILTLATLRDPSLAWRRCATTTTADGAEAALCRRRGWALERRPRDRVSGARNFPRSGG